MASGKKIAENIAETRTVGPFIAWLRDKGLLAKRETRPREGWIPQQRFPDTQSARTQPAPTIPGGVHHKIAGNYYSEHDVRRMRAPPTEIYAEKVGQIESGAKAVSTTAKSTTVAKVGGLEFTVARQLPVPTPGFGATWKRRVDEELPNLRRIPPAE